MSPPSELLEETQVVSPESTDVLDPMLEHRQSLRPHAEGEAGEAGRGVTTVDQHRRMTHAAAEHFQPAGALAYRTADAAADEALDVHLGRRLSEGEMRRAKAGRHRRAEQAAGEGGQGPLEGGARGGLSGGPPPP